MTKQYKLDLRFNWFLTWQFFAIRRSKKYSIIIEISLLILFNFEVKINLRFFWSALAEFEWLNASWREKKINETYSKQKDDLFRVK